MGRINLDQSMYLKHNSLNSTKFCNEGSGDVIVVPEAFDGPTPMEAAPTKVAFGIAHILKKSVAVLLYHDRPMVIIATPKLPQKLSWLILHERKAVFIVVSTLASFH